MLFRAFNLLQEFLELIVSLLLLRYAWPRLNHVMKLMEVVLNKGGIALANKLNHVVEELWLICAALLILNVAFDSPCTSLCLKSV